MNHSLTLLKRTMAVCAALIAVLGASVQAQTPGTDVRADVSLITSETITQGEPIILKYDVTNVSGMQRYIGLNEDSSNWLSLSLVDATGHLVSGHSVSNPNQMDTEANFSTTKSPFDTPGSIAAHATLAGYVVANQWFLMPAPGRYTLAAHIHLFYRVVSTSAPTDGQMNEQDFTFPLTITKADSTRLQATAQTLETAILQVHPTEPLAKRSMLIRALFSMPSIQAGPSWQALISDPSSSSRVILGAVDNLTCLRSAAATDILIGMRLNPTPAQDKYVTSEVVGAIAGIYRDADPVLRQHIRQIYALNGVPLSNTVLVPGRVGHGN